MRPGINILKKIIDIKKWLGWYGEIILYLDWGGRIKNSNYHLKSIYDGSEIVISLEDLMPILMNINPDRIVDSKHLKDFLFEITDRAETLAKAGEVIVKQSNNSDSKCKILHIGDRSFINDTNILSETCMCSVCQQGFSKAYLCHLYQQTPLLAHRYLAIHNFFLL